MAKVRRRHQRNAINGGFKLEFSQPFEVGGVLDERLQNSNHIGKAESAAAIGANATSAYDRFHGIPRLVWWFRSPHYSCGESAMRTSEPKPNYSDIPGLVPGIHVFADFQH